jgi:hypothetical protein
MVMVESLHLQERELADAILEGVQRRPEQSFGEYFKGRKSSCALGAAYEGLYRLPREADGIKPRRLDLLFECLDNAVRVCPECAKKRLPLGAIIIHLNDHHHWTREQIASWLKRDADEHTV